jgi:hypothetical protein
VITKPLLDDAILEAVADLIGQPRHGAQPRPR